MTVDDIAMSAGMHEMPGRVMYAVKRAAVPPRKDAEARERRYAPEELLEAIREWAALHGEPPTVADWEPARARREGQAWRAERYAEREWPTARMLRTAFGTMTKAVIAAGLTPRRAPTRVRPRLRAPEEVLEAMRAWTMRYGEPPTLADWDPARARAAGHLWRVRRYESGDWPSTRTVLHHYGNFGRASQAAGLEPRPHGRQPAEADAWRRRNLRAVATPREDAADPPADELARRVVAVAEARRQPDPAALRLALVELAASALGWADSLHEPHAAPVTSQA